MKNAFSQFHFMPDAVSGGGSSDFPPPKKSTPRLPDKNADVAAIAAAVSKNWSLNPHITLVWITAAQFAAQAAAYAVSTQNTLLASSGRPSQTQRLRQLDRTAEKGLSSLRIDIQQHFGKAEAYAEYARYGLERKKDHYGLPRDRNRRLAALRLTLAAVQADGTGSGHYDAAFWTTLLADYEQAMQDARQTDSSISTLAGATKMQKKNILKAMRALQKVLQGNYPDTYKAVFREWGWQKEDY